MNILASDRRQQRIKETLKTENCQILVLMSVNLIEVWQGTIGQTTCSLYTPILAPRTNTRTVWRPLHCKHIDLLTKIPSG